MQSRLRVRVLLALAGCALVTAQQSGSPGIISSFPHNYTGIPAGDYGTEWQSYFEVTGSLPNVTTGSLPRNFAGNIAVNRAGHPNDTLFFWGFERENGSLTTGAGERSDEPWLIWLNGGPGSSSLIGFMEENGPLHVTNTFGIVHNNFSWNTLTDAFWIDQPVGVGFSTADATGYIADEDQMGEDFVGFLSNLVKVFPSLATRPLFLTGESYAGVYIPYITKTIFSTENPPVKLRKIAIGDGSIGSINAITEMPVLSVLETYPQLIDYDQEVFAYFRTQSHLCGYDLNLTYPQTSHFPTITVIPPTATLSPSSSFQRIANLDLRRSWRKTVDENTVSSFVGLDKRELEVMERRRVEYKRDLTGRSNDTIDPFYGCFLYEFMLDYVSNFTFPWNLGGFDVYDIPDALNPEAPLDPTAFLNDDQTRTALHAPTSKDWAASIAYPFGSSFDTAPGENEFGDPSIEPVTFLSELASNATANNVSIIIYSGNDDSLVSHLSSEVAIQNTTFGGIQGFSRKPSTPWFDDDGNFAGIVHQERNITYVLFDNTGHLVPQNAPAAALVFLREFILGDNTTGLVINTSSSISVIGGENASELIGDILPGSPEIFYGPGTTLSSTAAPTATIDAWRSFLETATAISGASSAQKTGGSTSGVNKLTVSLQMLLLVSVSFLWVL